MIQKGTLLNVIDNSGAKKVLCIHISSGYKHRYAGIGDSILVSVKSLRTKRKSTSKVKKGEVHKAIVLRVKNFYTSFYGDKFGFIENSVVLLNKQNKFFCTKVFGAIPKFFRFSKFLRLSSLSAGSIC